MSFDYINFLQSYGVHYVTSGPNCAKGHASIHCPWCGAQDPSQHLTIHLEGKGWRCYRNAQHAGKSPVRLVQHVLGISREQAMRVVGQGTFLPDDFLAAVHSKMGIGVAPEPEARSLRVPKEFKPLSDKLHSARLFYSYMINDRGFTRAQVDRMYDLHDLMYATRGRMLGRIVFPIYFQGKLQTWTGRAIDKTVELRYRTLSTDPELEAEPANGPINDFLLWYDDLLEYGGEILMLCEGPFDALKVTTLGRRYGIEGTCCFTAQPSASQMDYLYDIAPKFKRRFVLLDSGTLAASLKTSSAISQLGFKPLMLPTWLKDPGELRKAQTLLDLIPR